VCNLRMCELRPRPFDLCTHADFACSVGRGAGLDHPENPRQQIVRTLEGLALAPWRLVKSHDYVYSAPTQTAVCRMNHFPPLLKQLLWSSNLNPLRERVATVWVDGSGTRFTFFIQVSKSGLTFSIRFPLCMS
jgi:hypothetical protein